ncbi:flagellar hook-length control protein FliK [Candidatus Magnetominusculus dajiuhuensis]|uniref:flagellar hook-length control protein FliK n=1 Tax=Candidatus Magnetominusculus dajiuhuensis TaxID=3137712 RepID=UPI003B42876E
MAKPTPRHEAREASAPRPGADDARNDTSASSSTAHSRRDPSATRSNGDSSANRPDNGQQRTNYSTDSASQTSNTTQEAKDSTSQRSDDTATDKNGEQFNAILDKLMKGGKVSKNNSVAAALAAPTAVAALQPTGITGIGVQPVAVNTSNTANTAILSLLGEQQTSNAKPGTTPDAKPAKDPDTKTDTDSSKPQPVVTDVNTANTTILSLLGAGQTSNAKPGTTPDAKPAKNPDTKTDTDSSKPQPVGTDVNTANTTILSLLGAQPTSNTKPETTPDTKAAKDPDTKTDTDSSKPQPVGTDVNTANTTVLSLLGAQPTSNTKPETTPDTKAAKDPNTKTDTDSSKPRPVGADVNTANTTVLSLLGAQPTSDAKPAKDPDTKTDTDNSKPQPVGVDIRAAKDAILSLPVAGQTSNVKPETTPDTKTDTANLTPDTIEQAFAKLTPQSGSENTATPQTKIPETQTGRAITPEMLTTAMRALNVKTPDNNPRETEIADLNSARHSKRDVSSKDSSGTIKDVPSNGNVPDNNLSEVNLADSNGAQLSKHDQPSKDTSDAIKDISLKSGGDSKHDDGTSTTTVSADKTQQPFHEVVGKAAHTETANTGDTGEKLAVGASKTIELNGSKFTIMRKGDTSIEVKLEPDGMGKLDLHVNVEKGVLTANISASDSSAKGVIEKNLHDIVGALTKEGLTVGGFTVSLKDRGGNFKEGKNENSANKSQKEQRQIQPVAITGYVKTGYKINDGISIFA